MTRMIIVLVAVSACGRLERDCALTVRGACIGAIDTEVSFPAELWAEVVDLTAARYDAQYDVTVNTTTLAASQDLYVVMLSDRQVTMAWCDGSWGGCYVWPFDEIYLNGDRTPIEIAETFVHELIHFWNRYGLRYVHPEAFEPWGFSDAEASHRTRHAFSFPHNDGVEDLESVESLAEADVGQWLRDRCVTTRLRQVTCNVSAEQGASPVE
jgi:hypothetical protein